MKKTVKIAILGLFSLSFNIQSLTLKEKMIAFFSEVNDTMQVVSKAGEKHFKLNFAMNPTTGKTEPLVYNSILGTYQFANGAVYIGVDNISHLADSMFSQKQEGNKIEASLTSENKSLQNFWDVIKTHKKKLITSVIFLACVTGGIYKYKKG